MRRSTRQLTEPQKFMRRVARWATRLRVTPTVVRMQRMTTKWASCSPRGRLTFATDLLGKPSRFQTAVIVHELLHLAVPNHGPLFRSLMRAHLPDVRQQWVGRAHGCGMSAGPKVG